MFTKLLIVSIIFGCAFAWNSEVLLSDDQIEKVITADDNINSGDYESRGTDIMITNRNKPNSHPVVATYGSNIYLACEGVYSGYPCIDVYRSTNGGSSWTYVTGWYYSSTNVAAYFPAIAVTSSYVTVTFDKRVNNALDTIRCARIPVGGTSPSFYYVDYPSRGTSDIAAYGNTVYCVYRYTYSTSDWDIEFRRSTDGGATWSSRVTVGGLWPINFPYEMPKIYPVTNTILIAAWHYWSSTQSNYYLCYSKSTNAGSSWSADQYAFGSRHPDIVGYQNTYLIVCMTYPNNYLRYHYTFDAGSSWSFHDMQTGTYYYPQCTYNNGYWCAVYTRGNRVYCSIKNNVQNLDNGVALTDGNYAQNDVIGVTPTSSGFLCLWKDSRNGTSIYCDVAVTGIEEETFQSSISVSGLLGIYPNPVSSKAIIKYSIANPSRVELKIFNVTGREVATLVNENQKPGYYQVNWDIRNFSEKELSNGVYFYRLTAGDYTETKKMVIIR